MQRFVQRIEVPNPKTFVGSGKILEIGDYVKENEIGSVIFDDELMRFGQHIIMISNQLSILRIKI